MRELPGNQYERRFKVKRVMLSVVCQKDTESVEVFANPNHKIEQVAQRSLDYFNRRKVHADARVLKADGTVLTGSDTVSEAGLHSGSVVVLEVVPRHSRRKPWLYQSRNTERR